MRHEPFKPPLITGVDNYEGARSLWENEVTLRKYLAQLKQLMEPEYKPPRRICLDKLTPAEKAIYDAIQAVEQAGAHPLLTKATLLLSEAKDAVADFVDGKH
jgi:hypothetical protein